MMTRYRARLAYDGTAYSGYQRQAAGIRTVQGEVEATLARLFKQPVTVLAAGRTDAGVHARGQVIAFDATWRQDDDQLLRAINAGLPDDIALQAIRQQPGFHPRFDARSRTYRYEVLIAAVRQPLVRRRAWRKHQALDLIAMQTAAALLIGKHDFATFGKPPEGTNTVRELFRSIWQQEAVEAGQRLTYIIEGTAFLQHMVRRIVGMLVEVGSGRRSLQAFEDAFRAADLSQAGHLAPPHGLYLQSVQYADDPTDDANWQQTDETRRATPHL